MEMQTEKLDGDVTRVRLVGRMDYAGATEIDARFMELAGREKFVQDKTAILEQEIEKVYRIMAVKPEASAMDIIRSRKVGPGIPIQVSRPEYKP